MVRKIHLLLTLLWLALIFNCGLPNPYDSGSTLNPPHKIISLTSNNNFRFSIYGFNNEKNAPNFTGYNLYYGNLASENIIRSNLIVINNQVRPTIAALPDDDISVSEVLFSSTLYYTNLININQEQSSVDINLFTSYFFIIVSYDSLFGKESGYFSIIEIRPSKKIFNRSIDFNKIVSEENFTLTINAGGVTPGSGTTIQDSGYTTNWESIVEAPGNGYGKNTLPLGAGHLYLFNSGKDYGKFFIISKNPSGINFNLSYQKNSKKITCK